MQFRLRNFMMAALAVFAIAFTGCDPEEKQLTGASLEVLVADGMDSLSVDGGSFQIAVTTNRDWAVAVSQDWLSVDKESGNGNAIVAVTALANDGAARKATLTFTASTKTEVVEIFQAGEGEGSWVVPEGSESVKGFYAAATGGDYTLEDVVIDYQYQNYNFVSAGGKTILVFDDSVGETAGVGDKVTVTGKVVDYYGVMQLQYPVTVVSHEASTNDIKPLILEVATYGENYMEYQNQLVCFEDVTISGTTITQGAATTAYYDKLSISAPTSGNFDVLGYAAQYKGAHQIYPVAFVAVGEGKNYKPDTTGNTGGGNTGGTEGDGNTGGDDTTTTPAPGVVEGAIFQEFCGDAAATDTEYPYDNAGTFAAWSKLGSGAANVTFAGSDIVTLRGSLASNYTGASAGNNVFFGNDAPTYFEVKNIAVAGVKNFTLSFGTIEGKNNANGADGVVSSETFKVSYSIDGGTTYTEIPVTYSNDTNWQYVSASFTTAGSETMNIKFDATLKSVQRVDDILLVEAK